MNKTMPIVAPLKSWLTLKTLRAKYSEYLVGKEKDASALALYAETGVVHSFFTLQPADYSDIPEKDRPPPSGCVEITNGLSIYALTLIKQELLYDAVNQNPEVWRAALLSMELHCLLRFKIEAAFPAKFGRNLRMMDIGHAGWAGLAAGYGAIEVMERWAPLLVEAARRGYILEYKYEGMHHWILRLWCKARGFEYPQTGYPIYEVAEGILEMWDTADTETLAAWLVQLCNLHTQLSQPKQFMDFVNIFSHVPVEIMMLFRLREELGLSNPEVDHPLMRFPWSKLQPIQKAEPDELLSGIYRRLEQDEGITVSGLYQQLLA